MAGEDHRLEVDKMGPANFLNVGDRFVFGDGPDTREHTVTQDLGSHFEYDGRPNKRLSKDALVKRVGQPDPGERTERAVSALTIAVRGLETTGDVAQWSNAISDVISRVVTYGMDDSVIHTLEKLEKQGQAVFARARLSHGKSAIDSLTNAVRKRWTADVNVTLQNVREGLFESRLELRELVREVVQSHAKSRS